MALNPRPDGLNAKGAQAYDTIAGLLKRRRATYTGGGTTFWAPEEWVVIRGEEHGARSVLVVTYDGGDVASFFRMGDDDRRYSAMRDALAAIGCYAEECTGWYSAIYVKPAPQAVPRG